MQIQNVNYYHSFQIIIIIIIKIILVMQIMIVIFGQYVIKYQRHVKDYQRHVKRKIVQDMADVFLSKQQLISQILIQIYQMI